MNPPSPFFLAIDLKKLSSDVQLRKPLTKYIEDQGSKVDDFQEALNELEKLRENIRQATPDKKDGVLALYYRYYALLSSIDKRVPINEQEVRVNFNWYDIYKQKKLGRYSINYEKACLLFNVACLHSKLGSQENLDTTDGIKNACKMFKIAAGVFEQVKGLLEKNPQDAATEDLSGDSLNMLHTLMISQAQELFFIMAVKTNMKPAACSKLAAQAADFYSSALELMQSTSIKAILPKNWPAYTELKRDVMKGCAHYQLGRHLASEHTYGEELARYKVAHKYFSQAGKFKGQITEITPWFDQNFNAVQSACIAAERDNNTIYHETVPSEHKLKALEKKAMVEAEKITDDKLKVAPTADPFSKLIPFRVRKADSVFSERKAELIRNLASELEKSNATVKKTLNNLGLPGIIEALETPHGIPLSLLQKMEHVRNEGGSAYLNEQLETLHRLASENSTLLDTAVRILDEEENDDSQSRVQYGSLWIRTPSHTLNLSFRQEANKYKSNVEHSVKSDQFIKTSLIEWQRGIDSLTQDQGQILALLPEASKQDVSVIPLKKLLQEKDEIIQKSEEALNQLKDALSREDILEPLIKSQESEQETVFATALSKYDGHIALIRKACNVTDLLTKIEEETKIFNQRKSTNAQLLQRQQVLQEFEVAYQNYLQLKAYLGEGAQFYTNLQEMLQKFKVKCSDFSIARKTEKQDLVVSIQTRQNPQMTQAPGHFGDFSTSQQQQHPVMQQSMHQPPPSVQPQQPILFMPQNLQMSGRGPILVPTVSAQPVKVNQGAPVFYMQQQPQFHQPQIQQPTFGQQQQYSQQQPQFHQPQMHQQPQIQQQQYSQPPPYTQSQAQRSVFPADPYGNLPNTPPTGF